MSCPNYNKIIIKFRQQKYYQKTLIVLALILKCSIIKKSFGCDDADERIWRNWQTRTVQVRVLVNDVEVRILLSAPKKDINFDTKRIMIDVFLYYRIITGLQTDREISVMKPLEHPHSAFYPAASSLLRQRISPYRNDLRPICISPTGAHLSLHGI